MSNLKIFKSFLSIILNYQVYYENLIIINKIYIFIIILIVIYILKKRILRIKVNKF